MRTYQLRPRRAGDEAVVAAGNEVGGNVITDETSVALYAVLVEEVKGLIDELNGWMVGDGTGGGSIGGGVAGTVTQTPPASYSPPSQTGVYPPPTGNLPYYNQPPPYGGNSFYGHPPPPDPIMPYFPFYYRKPPHKTDDQSSGTTVRPGKSIFFITALPLLPQIFLYLLF
ncbi:hypothetical protein V6N11_075286 [Hibiscus sabdariffa]|uniref:Uncharacterized protein n=1 Tax=Hibiscus sabdariffa TaxID=183260 RepID=A0ABR2R615_9ROSI